MIAGLIIYAANAMVSI